ncbi:MAG: riboflavin synthase [bacterium]
MFTGIIEATGQIKHRLAMGGDERLTIHSSSLDFSDVKIGDSIAVNGVCLTVVDLADQQFSVDVSKETLKLTSIGQLNQSSRLNLEKAMQMSDRLGGHIVSGHVDGLAHVVKSWNEARASRYILQAPRHLAGFIAAKGSVALDGISLTVNEVDQQLFHINIVPHTAQKTSFSQLVIGQKVNLEVDVFARYVARILDYDQSSTLDKEKLLQAGFINRSD